MDRTSREGLTIDSAAPLLIAGPCVIESEEQTLRLAEAISGLPAVKNFTFVFKASYLKDNRSSGDSYRGPGLEGGLEILRKVRDNVGCPVLSDVHCRDEVSPAADVLDILQIPAFLSRQTRLLEAVAGSGRAINIKKGQFLAPEDVGFIIDKIRKAGGTQVLVTERGSTFGYHDLVVDFRSFPKMKKYGCPVVLDVTHSLQKPAALGNRSGGEPELACVMARAAAAVPCDGFFIETHFSPGEALSDAAAMLPFSQLERLLEQVQRITSLVKEMARSRDGI